MRDRPGANTEHVPHLRADAERNRRRLIDAARTVFAEQGPEASIADIRQLAGVGQGTVFRHFPTKEKLLAAVVLEGVEEMIVIGDALLDADEPGDALREFMRTATKVRARDRCVSEAMCEVARVDDTVGARQEALTAVIAQLLRRAQDAGAVRTDVTPGDMVILGAAAARATIDFRDEAPELWRRYLDVILDGLRPEAAHPLSHEPPSDKQFRPPELGSSMPVGDAGGRGQQ